MNIKLVKGRKSMKIKSIYIFSVLIAIMGCAASPNEDLSSFQEISQGEPELVNALAIAAAKYDIPGLAAAIVDVDGLKSIGVYGVRRKGSQSPITIYDQWLLGSNTKAMTAAVIAKLVEDGKLNWNTRVIDVFPEYRNQIDKGYHSLDLIDLLSHQGGLPRDPQFPLSYFLSNIFNITRDDISLRKEFLLSVLSNKPIFEVGSTFQYSNIGYVIAGAVVEKVTGKSYEVNVEAYLLKPLNMTNSGFGGLGTPGIIDAPWGHNGNGYPDNINGEYSDKIPSFYTPAGRIHATLTDWAKFISDNLRYFDQGSTLLEQSSYARLFTPVGDNNSYSALGWGFGKARCNGHDVYGHDGSTGHYYARVVICPDKKVAILITANMGVAYSEIGSAMNGIEARIKRIIDSNNNSNLP